ncbi:MAG: hypothetical protein MUF29_04410 [Chitinophagaceae bacterium]|jgi:hypothetical protein|nr:hypothetical protein [Chitinophagaceae bacterium]
MFLGHFAAALAAKKADKQLSLGTTTLAAQWLDLLWPALLLTGTEQAALSASGSPVPLEFTHYPVSHSLLAVCGWALLFAGLYFLFTKKPRAAVIMALLVLSHWFLDLLVHVPDLPLAPGGTVKVGLGLWNHKIIETILEMALFALGVYWYFAANPLMPRSKKIISWSLIAFLPIVHLMNSLGAPPPSVQAVAVVGLSQWLLVAWAWWADPMRKDAPRHSSFA